MKIVFLGDSITDANHNYSDDALGEGYVKLVAEELRKKDSEVEILNKGHDGFTVFSLWKFLEYDCISKQPDIVSILIGCNDVSVKMSTGRTLEEQGFQEYYEKILKKIRQKTDAKIICMGPFIFPHPLEFANWIPDIKKAEEMAREASEKYDAVFVPLHDDLNERVLKCVKDLQNECQFEGKFAKEEKIRQTYEKITTDGTHLTEDGARIVAEKWLAETSNWLDKKV